MGRFGLAVRAFFRVWGDAAVAEQVAAVLAGGGAARLPAAAEAPARLGAPERPAAPVAAAKPAKPAGRGEALALLEAMQREGRLVDFLQESLDGYDDAQIGAAVRDVHRGCRGVLERVFDLKPLAAEAEGASIEVPAGYDPARYRLTGNVSGGPPFRGVVCHAGWIAARCELPAWSGSEEARRIVAPVEVEIR